MYEKSCTRNVLRESIYEKSLTRILNRGIYRGMEVQMKMLTIPELARLLGVTRVRAWQMLQEKKFKAVKFSHVYAVKESEAKKLLTKKELRKLKKLKNLETNHETIANVPVF